MSSIRVLQGKVYRLQFDKGWRRKGETREEFESHIPEQLCLIHSEVSEALEDYRNGEMKTRFSKPYPSGYGKPEGFPTELADIVIRVMGIAEALSIDLEAEIERKHAYNETRPHKHGGKRV